MHKTIIISLLSALFLQIPDAGAQSKKDRFLISMYGPPAAKYLNEEQFKVIKDGNIDIIINVGPGVEQDKAGNTKTLDMAQKFGLKVYIYDARVNQSDDQIKAMVNDFKSHPALAGYYVLDEPDTAKLASAIEMQKKVKALDPAKDAYINHLPDWAIDPKENYEHSFLPRYIEGVGKDKLNYLAYDNYPYKRGHRLEKTYFNNLEIIRRVGLKYNVKTSSCLQSFGMGFKGVVELRRPNADEMRMNVYSNLAYGVKNPVWYTYYTQDNLTPNFTMYKCVIDSAGVKTDMYEPFKKLNGEMKQLGKTLINLDAVEVYHTGDSLWLGTTRPPDQFMAKVSDPKAQTILSRFKDKSSGKQYLMVVNRNFNRSQPLTIRLDSSVKKVKEVSKQTGKTVKAPYDAKANTISQTFMPGEGKLFVIN
ncbi:hypothetical protein DYBT9275_02328 [Dyadobacter sp. CECT 9275]|uniref:Uncharacterized protein n=1 Tax=Dyadobacter helix TaxID=2822344 RepID=A0A916NC62_9BACT|nr:hypothetical protein [Dyadobacter sp. CECT 9275]CAG4999859.1 hypothetical protein DYBT9275_02328 [Dyadobacter sp. CECT 9275]